MWLLGSGGLGGQGGGVAGTGAGGQSLIVLQNVGGGEAGPQEVSGVQLQPAQEVTTVQLQPVAGQLLGSSGATVTTEAPNLLVVQSGAAEELLTGPGPGEARDVEASMGVAQDVLLRCCRAC